MPRAVEIGIEVNSDRATKQYKKLSKTVKNQNDKMISSSKQLEVQAVRALKDQQIAINNAMKAKKNSTKQAEQNSKKIAQAAKNERRAVEKAENKKQKAIKETLRKQKEAISKTKIFFLAFAGILTGVVGRALIDTQRSIDKINNALKVGKGTVEAAAIEFSFLEKEAARLGLEIESSALSYAKFTAAAKNSTLTTKEQREIFLGVSEAAAALGLSADETNGSMLALTQIISKGTVQSEELRGQLGERIPGAFGLAAKAMGLTEKALGKQLELGNVLATDLLPKLAKEMRKTFGETAAKGPENLNGRINLLNNAFFKLKQGFLAAGGLKFLTTGFNLATKAVEALNVEIDKLDRTKQEKGTLIPGSKEALENVIELQRELLRVRQIVAQQPTGKLEFDPTTRTVKRTGGSVETEQRKELIRLEKELKGLLGVSASLQKNAILNRISDQQEEIEVINHKQDVIDSTNNKLKDQNEILRKQKEEAKKVADVFARSSENFKLDELTEQFFTIEDKIKSFQEIAARAFDAGNQQIQIKALEQVKSLNEQLLDQEKEKNDKILEEAKKVADEKQKILEFSVNSASQITAQLAQLATVGIDNQIKSIQLAEKQADREKSLSEAKTVAEKKELKEQFAKEDKLNSLRKRAFETQQKFALAQAAMDTAGGVLNALTLKPANLVPFGVALALATGATQAAVIKSQKFAQGGIVQGPKSGDTVPIQANGGERILTARQNQSFEKMLDGGGQQVSFGDTVINISGNGDPGAIAEAVIQTRQEQFRKFGNTTKRTNSLQVRTI